MSHLCPRKVCILIANIHYIGIPIVKSQYCQYFLTRACEQGHRGLRKLGPINKTLSTEGAIKKGPKPRNWACVPLKTFYPKLFETQAVAFWDRTRVASNFTNFLYCFTKIITSKIMEAYFRQIGW